MVGVVPGEEREGEVPERRDGGGEVRIRDRGAGRASGSEARILERGCEDMERGRVGLGLPGSSGLAPSVRAVDKAFVHAIAVAWASAGGPVASLEPAMVDAAWAGPRAPCC